MNKATALLAVILLACAPTWAGGSRDFELADEDYISIPTDILSTSDTSYTFAAWINPESIVTGYVIQQGTTSLSEDSIRTLFMVSTGKVAFVVQDPDNDRCSVGGAAAATITSGEWSWVAGVQNGTATSGTSTCIRYLDNDVAGGAFNNAVTDPSTFDTARLGAFETPTSTINEFDGLIAHAHIYNRALSAEEIEQIRHCPGSIVDGLVAYWPLMDVGATIKDVASDSTTTNNGTVQSLDGPPVSLCNNGGN